MAKAARAAGIHLIVATDRTTPDIVTSSIRDSLPARLSYRVAGRAESRGILGDEGAEHLLPGGDSLLSTGAGEPVRIHGPMVSAEETASVAMSLKERGVPTYSVELSAPIPGTATAQGRPRTQPNDGYANGGHPNDGFDRPAYGYPGLDHPTDGYAQPDQTDELYDRAVAVAVRDGGASIGHLQSTLKVSPGWAANLLARLEADAVVGPADARGVHRVRPHANSQVA
ncbi:MAG: hypothetical protein HC841_01945 [Verrucomicrobiae bacterium]|nr:hypothetical protein [Verrucomicrobiae bacterium]